MLKQLLTIAAVGAMTLSASALDLSLEDLNSGWDSTYDPESKTITFNGNWTGRGWWLTSEEGVKSDFSEYTHVEIEVEPTLIQAQLVVQYNNGTDINETTGFCDLGTKKLEIALNPEYKDQVQQIYIQCGQLSSANTLTLKSAKVVDNTGVAPELILWEGEQKIDWWDNAVKVNGKDLREIANVNDYLSITYNLVGEWGSIKLLALNEDWTNTPMPCMESAITYQPEWGTISITSSGTLDVKLTEADIEIINAGIQCIMICGAGDEENGGYVEITKVEIVRENTEPLYTVGLEDNTTPWWSAFSKGVTLEGDGVIHYEFINYSDMGANWNNWLIVLTDSGLTPVDAGYGIEQELLVLRADNYGWGPLYDNTELTNDYNWDTFTSDLNGAEITMEITRIGDYVKLMSVAKALNGSIYHYNAEVGGVPGDKLGTFLTTEMGHLAIMKETVKSTGSISSVSADNDAPAVYYNLSGMKVNADNLPAGIYIVKKGEKTSKVIIR